MFRGITETQKIIDVHAHSLPKSYLAGLERLGIDPVAEDDFPTPAVAAKRMALQKDPALEPYLAGIMGNNAARLYGLSC